MPDTSEFLLICHLVITAGLTLNAAKLLLEGLNLPQEEYNNNLEILYKISNERL